MDQMQLNDNKMAIMKTSWLRQAALRSCNFGFASYTPQAAAGTVAFPMPSPMETLIIPR